MSTLTEQLTLPAPFDDLAQAGASMLPTGRRSITWTFHDAGKIHGNAFAWGHVDLRERDPWSSEVWVSGQRRLTSNGPRLPWTDRCTEQLSATLVAQVHAYGFDKLWQQLHRRKRQHDQGVAQRQAELAAELVRWWSEKAELDELYALDLVEVRKVTEHFRVPVPAGHGYHRTQLAQVQAELVFHDGSVLGYLVDDGSTCPASPRLQP